MKQKTPSVRLSVIILLIALCWRMIGAPLTRQDFIDLQTPLWQARMLLPSRMARVLQLWLPQPEAAEPSTMTEEADGGVKLAQEQPMITVYLAQEDRMVQMTLEGYVCGVVAAEMPARYHLEALKAQTVAARTRAMAQMEEGGCSKHPGADICTDSTHCQGYATLTQCREMWQDSYEAYRDRILSAQRATREQVLTYNGELITVLYHAMSGGQTEDAATVFSQSLPYLVSVESAGEESAQGFWTETRLSFEQIAERLNEQLPVSGLTAQDVQRTLAVSSYTETGRVRAVQIGGTQISAVDFRRALGLRSTWFSLSTDSTGVTFLQRGYGHGVGMSQVGANSMAADGAAYAAILAHYYQGTVLETR